jgi:hypothetical protein
MAKAFPGEGFFLGELAWPGVTTDVYGLLCPFPGDAEDFDWTWRLDLARQGKVTRHHLPAAMCTAGGSFPLQILFSASAKTGRSAGASRDRLRTICRRGRLQ